MGSCGIEATPHKPVDTGQSHGAQAKQSAKCRLRHYAATSANWQEGVTPVLAAACGQGLALPPILKVHHVPAQTTPRHSPPVDSQA